MKLLKNIMVSTLLVSNAILTMHCGGNPAAEGDKAFESANYNLAIKHYLEARKSKPAERQLFEEKIALSYMLRGKKLYDRSKNVKAFSGNFEKGLDYIPSEPSEKFNTDYSKILYDLAVAYINTRPENEIQKEDYLNKAIGYLEDAMVNDDTNTEADKLLAKIKSDNFQKMLDKGKDFYSKASKKGNEDYYITAEYYFQRAVDFDIHNKEAKSMLSKTRAKSLSLLNNREDFAMAIADMSRQSKNLILDLTIKNYATDPISIDLKNFEIVDVDGNSYSLNKKMMGEKFKGKSLQNMKLDELKYVDGIIVFSIPKKAKIDYLGYRLDEEETTKKYFP